MNLSVDTGTYVQDEPIAAAMGESRRREEQKVRRQTARSLPAASGR